MKKRRAFRRGAALIATLAVIASCVFTNGGSLIRAMEGEEQAETAADEAAESAGILPDTETGGQEESVEAAAETETEEIVEAAAEAEMEESSEAAAETETEESAEAAAEIENDPAEGVTGAEEGTEETGPAGEADVDRPETRDKAETADVAETTAENAAPEEAETVSDEEEAAAFTAGFGLLKYYREHIDPRYVPAVTKTEFVDFLDCRVSFIDRAFWTDANGDGRTELLDVASLPDFYEHMMTLPGLALFYDLSEDSAYYAALLPEDRDLPYPMAAFDLVVNNNAGKAFPADWYYDRNTHILYAAKGWFDACREAGAYISVRSQSVFLYDGDAFSLYRTIPVTTSVDQGKSDPLMIAPQLFNGSIAAGLMDREGVRFRLTEGGLPCPLTKDMLTVYVNGEKIPDFYYDPVTTELAVSFPLSALSDIHVDVQTENQGLRLKSARLQAVPVPESVESLLDYVTKDIFTEPLQMKVIPAVGDPVSFEHAVWIRGSNGNHLGNAIAIRYDKNLPEERFDWDFNFSPAIGYFKDLGTAIDALKSDPETVMRFLSDKTAFGAYGSPNEPYPVTACYDFELSGSMLLNGEKAAALPEGAKIQLYCTHATYADAVAHGLRDIGLQMDGAVNGTVIKVTDPGNDGIGYVYAAFGSNDFGNLNNGYVQAQFGVGRFPYRVLDAELKIRKVSAMPEMTEGNALYRTQEIVYGVYGEEACDTLLARLTVGKNGLSDTAALTPGTYWLKELSVPADAGYRLSKEVREVKLAGGETLTEEFEDVPVYLPFGLEILKTDADGQEIPGYRKDGAVFRVSFYAGQKDASNLPDQADAVFEIVSMTEESGSCRAVLDDKHLVSGSAVYGKDEKNGRFLLPLGVLKIEETKAPAGYLDTGVTYSLLNGGRREIGEGSALVVISAEQEKTVIAAADAKETADVIKLEAAEVKRTPEIRTEAYEEENGTDHTAAAENACICDLVRMRGLIPGASYRIRGALLDRESGAVLSEAELSFQAEAEDTEQVLRFEADLSAQAGKQAVAAETLYYLVPEEVPEDSPCSPGEEIKVAEHMDLDDEAQTVYVPALLTRAKEAASEAKNVPAGKEMRIIDEVTLTGLKTGETYRIEGVLMDTAAEKPALDDSGSAVTAMLEFTAEEETVKKEMTYEFSGENCSGKKLVVYEVLYLKEQRVAAHEDPSDEDQSIYVPSLDTEASAADGGKELPADDVTEICDLVRYTGLAPGETYRMHAVLMDKGSGEAFLEDGKKVEAELVFVPDKPEGEVTVTLKLRTSGLKDKKLVVFESCYQGETAVAVHHDIDSEAQTVTVRRRPSRTVILGAGRSGVLMMILMPASAVLLTAAAAVFLLLSRRRSH